MHLCFIAEGEKETCYVTRVTLHRSLYTLHPHILKKTCNDYPRHKCIDVQAGWVYGYTQMMSSGHMTTLAIFCCGNTEYCNWLPRDIQNDGVGRELVLGQRDVFLLYGR
jgi:hypothetical protein